MFTTSETSSIVSSNSKRPFLKRRPSANGGVDRVDPRVVEDDSDDEFYASTIMYTAQEGSTRKHGGSDRGKRANIDRERAEWGARLINATTSINCLMLLVCSAFCQSKK
ncbi:hypothetical protein PI124_g17106 [Phytophthora idaei]|nr:hypothetical protein PI125_g17638 [Phytophthora idaei]KAG3131429.1 hypothetical protein PI126_g20058 [Phytophthora idaei]KAG3237920.1 hypothetical protein PI124_g17106 [Phytophthora idaei]